MIDTRDKRMSLIGFGLPVPRVLPDPDGDVAVADRPQLLFLYAGLTLELPVEVPDVPVYEADVAIRLTATITVEL
jgi:hypothetical protein